MDTKTAEKPKAQADEIPPNTNLPAERTGGTALEVVEIDEEDRGAGLKNIAEDERKVSFIRILQTNSPECTEGEAKYMSYAKPGMFMDTATKQLFKSLVMVPCARDHKYIEYIPRSLGSGFVQVRKPNDEVVLVLRAKQGKFGKLSYNVAKRNDKGEALDGTEIVESFEIYGIFIDPETGTKFRAIAPFQSTQIGKYTTLVDRADGFEYLVAGSDVPVKPAFYSHKWLLTTALEKNKKGSFRGYVVGLLAKKEDGSDDAPIKSFIKKSDPLFVVAKKFAAFVEAGHAEVGYSQGKDDAVDAKPEDEVEM